MAAHQAPPSLGFSRQEHWSGLPFPPPMHENEVVQSCPTLSDPMDCTLPGSSVHGILQARVLEWPQPPPGKQAHGQWPVPLSLKPWPSGTLSLPGPSGQLRVIAHVPDSPELAAPTGLNLGLPAALNSSHVTSGLSHGPRHPTCQRRREGTGHPHTL